MPQVQVKIGSRPRRSASADPPTINRKIARLWFPESEQPTLLPAAWASASRIGAVAARVVCGRLGWWVSSCCPAGS